MSFWTNDRIEAVKARWLAGDSAAQIAMAMGDGATRSGVLGKLNRLGLLKGRPGAALPERNEKSAEKVRAARSRRANISKAQMQAVRGPKTLKYPFNGDPTTPKPLEGDIHVLKSAAWHPLPGTVPVSLEAHREGQCRWPLGDVGSEAFAYCGCEVAAGSNYCAAHRRLSVAAPAPVKLRTPGQFYGLRRQMVAAE